MTLHEQVRVTVKVTVTVCHTAGHYGEEYDDCDSDSNYSISLAVYH